MVLKILIGNKIMLRLFSRLAAAVRFKTENGKHEYGNQDDSRSCVKEGASAMSLIPFPGRAPMGGFDETARQDNAKQDESDVELLDEQENPEVDGTVQGREANHEDHEESWEAPRGGTAKYRRRKQEALRAVSEKFAWVSQLDGFVYRAAPLSQRALTDAAFNRIAQNRWSFEYAAPPLYSHSRERPLAWYPNARYVFDLASAAKGNPYGFIVADRVDFAPGKPEMFTDATGKTVLNTYRARNEWANGGEIGGQEPRPFLDLIQHLCNDDPDTIRHILDWLAHLAQKPGEKIGHGLLMTSKTQGVGKSTLGRIAMALVGEICARRVTPQDLKGAFTGWLPGALVVVVDEVYEGGNWVFGKQAQAINY